MFVQIPAILYFERTDASDIVNYSALETLPDISILTSDYNIAKYESFGVGRKMTDSWS